MITFRHRGDFKNTEKFFKQITKRKYTRILESYARQGVAALASATPIDSGLTSKSWSYEISVSKNSISITWTNSNEVAGVPLAILLQYGHGTNNGGYVQGRDYINPAMRPIFDKMAEDLWREVTGT